MENKQFGEWEVLESIQDRCFVVKQENDSKKYILKKGRRVDREIKLLKELEHPNILTMVDYNLDTDDPYHVTEYCEFGKITTARFINDPKAVNVLLQRIFRGLAYCWSKGIAPRDFEIFLKDNGEETPHPVIGDLESFKKIRSINDLNKVTEGWKKKKERIISGALFNTQYG